MSWKHCCGLIKMKIQNNTIYFKSNPLFFWREITGSKSNTIRMLTPDENEELISFVEYNKYKYINICRSDDTRKEFTRAITDISKIGELLGNTIYVISWRGE